MIRVIAVLLALFLVAAPADAEPVAVEDIQQIVDRVRTENDFIALGAIVADVEGNILGLAVSGERVKGSGDPVQPNDAWHIGSNTKMLTALLYGRLVEQGKLQWGATLPELLPDLADEMDPAWQDITIEHILSHRSGLAANPGAMFFMTGRTSPASHASQRTRIAKAALSKPPVNTVGEFTYSNLGYMIAGAAIDRIAAEMGQDDYETLFLSDFVTKGEGWGFGAPPAGIEGHAKGLIGGLRRQGKGLKADNPPALAPAGTIHVPLAAHARFLSQFLRPDAATVTLQTPQPTSDSDYALGLGIYEDTAGFGRFYTHNGSNTMWLSRVTIAPEPGLIIIINTNQLRNADVDLFRALTIELVALYSSAAEGK